jgi:transcription antitermination factor NusG
MNFSALKNQNYWYAVYTRPRAEKKVYQRMLDHDFEAFLPLVKTVRQWSDRKKIVQVPLISSYVFVNMQEQHLNKTLTIHGAVNVLKHLGKPAKIRDVEIENLRILSGSSDKYEVENCKRLVEGIL